MSNPKGNLATLKKYSPKWKSGVTRTIRVPVALADKILEYGHKLDSDSLTQVSRDDSDDCDSLVEDDSEPSDDDVIKTQAKINQRLITEVKVLERESKSVAETLTQVLQVLEEVCKTRHTAKFTKTLNGKLRDGVIAPLKALTQVNQESESG